MLIFDIFVNLKTGYTKDGIYKFKRTKIAKNYISGWLLIDFLSLLPLFDIPMILETLYQQLRIDPFFGNVLLLNILLTLLDISSLWEGNVVAMLPVFFRGIRLIKIPRLLFYINSWRLHGSSITLQAHLPDGAVRLLELLYLTFNLTHWICCLWFFLGHYQGIFYKFSVT